MRIVLAMAALTMSAGTAFAGVTDCRKITNSEARLNCYDALPTAEVMSTAAAPALERFDPVTTGTVLQSVDISGFYAAAGLSMGAVNSFDDNGHFDWYESPTVNAVAGYNHMVGRNFIGVEADIRSNFGDQYLSTTANFEDFSGVIGGLPPSVTTQVTSSYQELFAPSLNVRFGRQIGDWVIFGKGGAGAAVLSVKDVTDRDCTTWGVSGDFGGFFPAPISCEDMSYAEGQARVGESTKTIVRPTATFGLGVERHFDHFFARVDGEVRHIFLNDDSKGDGITQFQAGAMLGVRF